VKESFWEKGVRKDASAKGLGPHDRVKRRVFTKEREGVFVVERRKRGGTNICERSTAKRVYSTLQITTNFTSTFRSKKEWQKKNGTRLLPYKPMDGKKWIPIATHCRRSGWGRKKEGVYEVRSEIGL